MKKGIRILCVIVILALFALMAMGSGSDDKEKEVKEPSSVTTGGTEASKNEKETTPAKEPATTQEPVATKEPEITIEEAVLYDENGIKITAKSFSTKSLFGPAVKLLIENNTEKSITVQARNESVNGYMVESMLSCDVAAGKKANDELVFMESDLKQAGITTIADMEFSFYFYDSASWTDSFESDLVTIKTSAAEGFTYTFDDSGHKVYDENGIEIVVKGLAKDDSWIGPQIVVYISNNSNKNFTVQARDVSINGFMVDSFFSTDVRIGKHAIDTITFMSSNLEENEIETIEEVELSFHVYDMEHWETIVDTAPVTIKFEG